MSKEKSMINSFFSLQKIYLLYQQQIKKNSIKSTKNNLDINGEFSDAQIINIKEEPLEDDHIILDYKCLICLATFSQRAKLKRHTTLTHKWAKTKIRLSKIDRQNVSNSNEIHNGADDNASGVSGLLELAKKLFSNKSKLNRSIVFVAFNAEEQGIFGSKSFVKSSFFDSKKIVSRTNKFSGVIYYNFNIKINSMGFQPQFQSFIRYQF